MKLSVKIVFLIVICLIGYSCRQKISQVGYEETHFINRETTIDIDTVFTLVDSTYIHPRNTKLIVGNINNYESRALLRFETLLSDTTLVITEDPKVTLYVRHHRVNDSIILYYAPIINKRFEENTNTLQDYPNWEKAAETEKWSTPGGDYTEADSILVTKKQLDTKQITFTINREIVDRWIKRPNENLGLIIYSDNISNNYIEFNSRFYGISMFTPKIFIKYTKPDSLEGIITNKIALPDSIEINNGTRNAFIYNSISENQWSAEDLYLSNIPPRSLYAKFDITQAAFKDTLITNISHLNIIQANLIFTVDKGSSVIADADTAYGFTIGIPDTALVITDNKYNYSKIPPQTRFGVSTKYKISQDEEISINVRYQLELMLLGLRENNGIVLLNNKVNTDFQFFRLYGLADGDKKPRLQIKYSIYKDKIE